MIATRLSSKMPAAIMPSDHDAIRFWNQIVDPQGIGMPKAIASELASFTGEPVEEVLRKMASGKDDLKRLWQDSAVRVSDPLSVASFYRSQIVEAYELADWHSGRTNGTPPPNYAKAALFAQNNGLIRVLDFGSGIGTGSICLAEVGCEVHSADVATDLLRVTAHRLKLRGIDYRPIDLLGEERPKLQYFDMVTCFDVLEHIPNQLAKLRELEAYLKPGGCLLVNLMNDSFHHDRPMHISSAGNWLELVRSTAMYPLWSATSHDLQVLRKSRVGRLRNRGAVLVAKLRGR